LGLGTTQKFIGKGPPKIIGLKGRPFKIFGKKEEEGFQTTT